MNITFNELLRYSKLKQEQIYINGQINPEYRELIEKISKASYQNQKIKDLINELQKATDYSEIEKLKNKFEGKTETKEEKISKQYGISLDSIEHIVLKDGKEYYKFYDIKTNRDIILSQDEKNQNMSEEFKKIQNETDVAKSDDAISNAEEAFKYQRLHTNNEVELYTINEVQNYQHLLRELNSEQLKKFMILLKNKDILHINYINPKEGLAIDEQHKVIAVEYNEKKQNFQVKYPNEYKYENDKIDQGIDEQDLQYDNSLNEPSEEVDVANDFPKEINGIDIDPEKVKLYYDYPEILDREQNIVTKEAYKQALEQYINKIQQEQKITNPDKVYVKKKPNNNFKNGYASLLLLTLTTGFSAGFIVGIMYLIIK